MKVYEYEYGDDRDGRRGVMLKEAELDGSDEENMDIANQIASAILEDSIDNINKFTVVLIDVEHRNRVHCHVNGYFYNEVEVTYSFVINPLDYMDLAIPILLQKVEEEAEANKWDYNEFSSLLELEEKLINAGYQNEILNKLTAIVEQHRADWLREYRGEE